MTHIGHFRAAAKLFGHFGLQIPCNQLELRQCGLQVFDDLLRNHGGRGQVVAVGQALVLEPENVQAGFVAGLVQHPFCNFPEH